MLKIRTFVGRLLPLAGIFGVVAERKLGTYALHEEDLQSVLGFGTLRDEHLSHLHVAFFFCKDQSRFAIL